MECTFTGDYPTLIIRNEDRPGAVGDVMPTALRETGGGGLAATPTGRRIAEELLGP